MVPQPGSQHQHLQAQNNQALPQTDGATCPAQDQTQALTARQDQGPPLGLGLLLQPGPQHHNNAAAPTQTGRALPLTDAAQAQVQDQPLPQPDERDQGPPQSTGTLQPGPLTINHAQIPTLCPGMAPGPSERDLGLRTLPPRERRFPPRKKRSQRSSEDQDHEK